MVQAAECGKLLLPLLTNIGPLYWTLQALNTLISINNQSIIINFIYLNFTCKNCSQLRSCNEVN